MYIKRGIENTDKAIFPGAGAWDIPLTAGTEMDMREWQKETGGVITGFNFCKSYEAKGLPCESVGVHFFLDDYQFERLWRKPDEYLELLRRFKFVLAPDFSLYTDHPRAVQLFDHFKKQWLSAYWERNGLTVIPTICWSDSTSFDWCFDGEPVGSVVAVSTKGTQGNAESREKFLAGYNQMLKRLHPKQVLLFGKEVGGLDGEIISMGYEFQDAFSTRILLD